MDQILHKRHHVIPHTETSFLATPGFPATLLSGVTQGGYWRADLGPNTVSTWLDQSGLGNNLTQSVAANQFLMTPGYKGRLCYRNPNLFSDCWFTMPNTVHVNSQQHGWWVAFRTRSFPLAGDRCIVAFNNAVTDLMTSGTGDQGSLRSFANGASQTFATLPYRSSVSFIILSATPAGITFRYNGVQAVGAAYGAITTTGARLFQRTDGYTINGEAYEFGLIDRAGFTAGEISSLESYAQIRYGPWPTFGQIVIAGDSIGEGQLATTTMGWPQILDNNIGSSYIQHSYATGGKQANNFIAANYVSLFNGALTKNIAVMTAGTNDVEGFIGNAAQKANYALTGMVNWLSGMQAAGFTSVACTILPRNDAGWVANPDNETARLSVNASLLALPAGVNVAIDTAGAPGLTDPTNPAFFDADQLHLVDGGFVAYEATVRPPLLAI